MPRKRLTRLEQQQRTRSRLMESAAKVFACKGMQQSSIDEVAEDAGYTKGAFYANFKNKEELYLAMLDESFAERIAEVERAFGTDESPPQQARHAAADFAAATRADPKKEGLFLQFTTYALQNESFREELLTRIATLRARFEEVYQQRAETYGIEPPVPMDRLVRMIIAMADGWCMWRLLEPGAVDDELFESMMEIFVVGIGAMAGLEVTPPEQPPAPRGAA